MTLEGIKEIGDRSQFALAFQLREDPDSDSPPEIRDSCGTIQIWIRDLNITTGVTAAGDAVSATECPLLPLVKWFVSQWDPLFHEDRLPGTERASSSAEWYTHALYTEIDERRFESLLDHRMAWWSSHGLGSALPDFRIPDVHFRRRDADIEISWTDAEWRGLQHGVQLSVQPGVTSVPVEVVCEVIERWCRAVLTELPNSTPEVQSLLGQLDEMRSSERTLKRLKLTAGLRKLEAAAREIRRFAGLTDGDITPTVKQLLGIQGHIGAEQTFAQLTVPVLLYRSSRPDLSESDLHALLRLADSLEAGAAGKFAEVYAPTKCPFAAEAATQNGYQLARTLRQKWNLPPSEALTGSSDLEKIVIYSHGIDICDVTLDDRGVEGVAIWMPDRMPRIAVNSTGRFSSTRWGRRMTLAHELCHLISDGTERIGVGMVSNAWAPYLPERRANAFAAMFLAPPEAIQQVLAPDPDRWQRRDLVHAMNRLGIGATTLCRHLQNLGWLSREGSLAWIEQLTAHDSEE